MISREEFASGRLRAYEKALGDLGLDPGDTARLACPTCSVAFAVELPVRDPGERAPTLANGSLFITCPNHCFADTAFEDFAPRWIDEPSNDLSIENSHCTRYWTDSPASRCPLCGIENYRETLRRQVQVIQALGADAPQAALVDATKDLIAVFDGVMRAMVQGHRANLAYALSQSTVAGVIAPATSDQLAALEACATRWAPPISFQNPGGTRKNLLKASCRCSSPHSDTDSCDTRIDIRKWVEQSLGPAVWCDLDRIAQKRHVHQHALGGADQRYIDSTADTSVRVGQLVPIHWQELESAAQACTCIGDKFFGYYLS